MAEIVLAYAATPVPTRSSTAREPASHEQASAFFDAMDWIRERGQKHEVQAVVTLFNEHFTNFFLENFPQICIGVGERNWGSTEAWRPTDRAWIRGDPQFAHHIIRHMLNSGFDPAFSHRLELDQALMSVYHELDPALELPLVPIVQNCAVEPLMPLWRWYTFGQALGDAIRCYQGLERVAIVGAGGLSHWIGTPRVGDIATDFDRWFLDRLERGKMDDVLDLTDDEIELAGNGAHEIRSWVAVAGAMAPAPGRTLAYETVRPWTTGMAVSHFEFR
jgi:catalytic LigB subunit of aromatic ring-opening dioxygenase